MTIHEVDADQALQRFLHLAAIPGRSGEESDVATEIIAALKACGVREEWIVFDDAHTRTRIKGNCGNLIVSLPGNGKGARTLISAHMDTVPICIGSRPVVEEDLVVSSEPTGLGADDRSGCCVLLTAIAERQRLGEDKCPPAVASFLIQEEVGLEGARHLDTAKIGDVDRAFNFDGGTVEKLTVGATGGERMTIEVTGIPAHAGVAPQEGVSAITIAARAITDLDENGWLGKVSKGEWQGTSNVGVIEGGEATNVVTPLVKLKAEARSHDAAFRDQIVSAIKKAFETAAASLTNEAGRTGAIQFESHVDYESFKLDSDHPSVQAAERAVREIGREPYQEVSGGGLDANWLYRHGVEAVTLGCGQRNIHTADEQLSIPDYLAACQIATRMITEGASDE